MKIDVSPLSFFAGRNRWVIYNEKHCQEYDGSMIPAEWFGWMHYKTDTPPTVVREGCSVC